MRGLKRIAIAASFAVATLTTAATTGFAAPQKSIPPAPQYYVLDQPHLLNAQATRALQALLIEHDRVTGEQFVVAIFDSLDGEDLNDFTNRVFQAWQIGQSEKDNGVLLAIFNKEHQARIEVGYGLEPELTDAKSSRILRDYLVPGMKAGQPDEAVTQSALQILQALDSPLIQNGRAQQILRSGGVLRTDIRSAPMQNGWIVWLVLGLILMTIVSHIMSSAEAHFTRSGWYRPRPWRRRWGNDDDWGGPGAGGGFFGGWGSGGGGGWGGGGDGGFSGGGGRSGGGGASAGW
jgi:uncharacterized protein